MFRSSVAAFALLVSFILLSSPGVAFTAPASVLAGRVLDDLEAAAPGVAVFVTSLEPPNETFEGSTDDAGVFRIAVPHDGGYRVTLGGTDGESCVAVNLNSDRFTRCTLRIVRPRASIIGAVRQQDILQENVVVAAFRRTELDKDEPSPDQVAVTNREGQFELRGLRRGEVYVLHAVKKNRLWPVSVVVSPPANDVDIVLPRPATLAGRVIRSSGDALATRFTVTCRDAEADGEDAPKEGTFRSQDGAFLIKDMRPANWTCRVIAIGYAPYRFEVTLSDSEVKDDVSVRLRRGAVLTGAVRNEAGELVRGAVVSLTNGESTTRLSKVTDVRGRFSFSDLDADRHELTVGHRDYADWYSDVEVYRPTTTKDVTLLAGRTVSGIVMAEGTRPAAGVQIGLAVDGDDGFNRLETHANRMGQFTFLHVRTGNYVLSATEPNAAAVLKLTVGDTNVTGVVVQLKSRQIQGRVYGLNSDEAVPISTTNAVGFSATTATKFGGAFRLVGVPSGPLTVSARRVNPVSGGTVEKQIDTVVPEDGDATVLEIRFDDGCAIAGRLTRAGIPIGDTTVVLVSSRTGSSVSARTNANGDFVFEAVETGPHDLSIPDRLHGAPVRRLVDACTSKPVDVDLPSATLSIQVLEDDDEPASAATVKLIKADDSTVASSEAITQGNGQVTFSDLDPLAHYTLAVDKSGFQNKQIDVVGEATTGELVVVRLQRGEGLWLRPVDQLGMSVRVVSARAVTADGRERFMGRVSTDERGVASLPLAPGRYMLRVHAAEYAAVLLRDVSVPQKVLPVLLSAGGSAQFQIDTARVPLRVEITGFDGGEVPLAFENPNGEVWLRQPLTTIQHLAVGRYKVRVDGAESDFEIRAEESTLVNVP